MFFALKTFFVIVCISSCIACTHVTVLGVSGPVEHHFFGIAIFRPDKSAPITYFRQQAVGASVGAKNMTVGYLREEVFQVNNPSMCGAVLFIDDTQDQKWARELLAKTWGTAPPFNLVDLKESSNAK